MSGRLHHTVKETSVPLISLFASTGTLLCCALPALMVSIGAGAALAGFVSTFPWLVALSKYKVWTFGISGALLLFAGIMQWRARYLPCPTDPALARLCTRLRRISLWVYGGAVIIHGVGFFFAFIAVYLL